MNKTKEEVLQPHISTYQSDNGESDFDFIWPENASKAMDEYTTHLTDQIKSMEKQAVLDLDTIVNQRAIIKSMENYISDVDGQVKELREQNKKLQFIIDIKDPSVTISRLSSQLESLQKDKQSDAVEFMNWTLTADCNYECTDEDQWNQIDTRESITTQELYEIFKSTLTN